MCSYHTLYQSGELKDRIAQAKDQLRSCSFCPRNCQVDRLDARQLGVCQTGELALVASYTPHFGEERPLVGRGGSGTIFFGQCSLHCLFCQNYEISHCQPGDGECAALPPESLAQLMLDLEKKGCHNINFVTPSHVIPQILEALPYAIEKGFSLPLVYNSSGYDSVASLKLLEDVIDIYMPDFKFWTAASGKTYAGAPDYPAVAKQAIREMHRQVGDLVLDGDGLATKGVLIRHLLMPGTLDESKEIINFIATAVSAETYLNIMDQYRPCGRAVEIDALNHTVSPGEYQDAMAYAKAVGLHRLEEVDFLSLLKNLGVLPEGS